MDEAPDVAGLPGAELVVAGVRDLDRGELTVPALLVSAARRRLGELGIAVPDARTPEPERQLYLRLEADDPAGAYEHYRALRRRLVSFCEAAEHARRRDR